MSTKSTDPKEAQRIADRLELEAETESAKRGKSASLAGITDLSHKMQQLAVSGRLDETSFRELTNKVLEAAGQERLDAVTNKAFCDTWRASKNGAVTERTRLKYDQVCRDWLDFLGPKAAKPIDSVTKNDVVAFRDKMACNGLTPTTTNQTVKLVRGIYYEAVEQGLLGRNPFVGVAPVRDVAEDTKRQPFTTEEVQKLIETAEGDWKGLVMLAATSGLRLKDCANLQWRNLDMTEKTLRIKTSKTGAKLEIPIHPLLAAWLEEQPRGIAAAPVFPTLAN